MASTAGAVTMAMVAADSSDLPGAIWLAAAASVALACLVTIFPPDSTAKNHRVIAKTLDWSKFDKELFETAAAIEISHHCISIAGTPDAPNQNLPVIEEEQEQF